MKRQLCIALVAVALAVPFSGALAQTPQPGAHERLLSVSGEGNVHARPDMAVVTLGVVSQDANASAALSANSESMVRLLDALKNAEGIEARDLQTSGFSVQPVYSQPPRDYDNSKPFEPKIIGYRVHNNLTVRIRDLQRVGTILDQVVKLGANSISGPAFTVADPRPLEDEARRAAVDDALRKGKLYADAAGVALGPIFRIEESYSRPPRPLAAAAPMRMAAEGAVPIEGGELTFEAQVSVSWQLAE